MQNKFQFTYEHVEWYVYVHSTTLNFWYTPITHKVLRIQVCKQVVTKLLVASCCNTFGTNC
jgi:hypothetical protein